MCKSRPVQEVASEIGIHQTTLHNWVNGAKTAGTSTIRKKPIYKHGAELLAKIIADVERGKLKREEIAKKHGVHVSSVHRAIAKARKGGNGKSKGKVTKATAPARKPGPKPGFTKKRTAVVNGQEVAVLKARIAKLEKDNSVLKDAVRVFSGSDGS